MLGGGGPIIKEGPTLQPSYNYFRGLGAYNRVIMTLSPQVGPPMQRA